MSNAPDEIWLCKNNESIWTEEELSYSWIDTNVPEVKENLEHYHHDRKYQKAIEALKETIELIENWTDPEDILEAINKKLKELGEIE